MGLRENLWQNLISEVEVPARLSLSPQTPIREVIQAMRQAKVGCAPICDQGILCGVFTEQDYVRRVLAAGVELSRPVREVMTASPAAVRRSDAIGTAIRIMYQGHHRHLPVIDGQHRLLGIVSVKRIVQYLVDHVPAAVYNLPPRPDQVQVAREGA